MIKIVHELRMAKGTNKKLEILKQHGNNENWLTALKYMYTSSINFYTSAPNDCTFVDDDIDYNGMFHLLDRMSQGVYTGNNAKFMARQGSEDYGEIFRLILGGSLRAGVSVTTINKAYKDLIPTFPLMLAEESKVLQFPILSSIKYDGVRLLVYVNDGTVTSKLRSGKLLNLTSLIDNMKSFPNGVYDGELVRGDGLQESRTKITGDVNRILKGTSDDIDDYCAVFFDYMSLHEWDNRHTKKRYIDRFEDLSYIIDQYNSSSKIKNIELKQLFSYDDVENAFEHVLSRGYEGLILRYPDDLYVWERTNTLIKKKAVKECILTCVGTQEGKGKYIGMIGALLCSGEVNGKPIGVKVGSGLSDYDRDLDEDYYIGKEVELLYNDIVQNQHDSSAYSLFLPRFKRVLGSLDT